MTQEKRIEMVFFSIIGSIKSDQNFELMTTWKAYLKDFFFERLCLAWKVSKENIIFIPFLGLVKSLIKGDHFWPFFWRFCVKKNAGTDPVSSHLPSLVASRRLPESYEGDRISSRPSFNRGSSTTFDIYTLFQIPTWRSWGTPNLGF